MVPPSNHTEGPPKFLAFYLPQFHPLAENDEWWGSGFTEWTHVAAARPLFRGHEQPHIPADLGFYDLRLPDVRQAQAELALRHGIDGFCYWHYWFEGRRLLERPFNDMLASREEAFPFCLAWANESWSRRWLGEERDILVKQTYRPEDDVKHVRSLLPAFADPRYVRAHGRPLFLIYRPLDLPNPRQTTDVFRDECIRHGLPEPYLVGVDAHCPGMDCRSLGFDSTLRFEPQLGVLPAFLSDGTRIGKLARNLRQGILSSRLKVYDDAWARARMAAGRPQFPHHPCVYVRWDNTPRRGRNGIVLANSSPERFEAALRAATDIASRSDTDEQLVFINAWNEWGEGNHLEPDARWGHGFLRAVARVKATVLPSCADAKPQATDGTRLRVVGVGDETIREKPSAAPGTIALQPPRLIAFYLPQYHPIPENDEWWGAGFTDWKNVAKARPWFRGQQQPHLPADLGFYDLRLAETRASQAELARSYGIGGFCYFHYWFHGRRLLQRPFKEVLATGEPEFPFCLCWANENWTRSWDGQSRRVLIEQTYSEADDLQHIRYLAAAFRDPRYIRVDGKPLFLVYRASRLPNPAVTTAIWREEARKLGLGELFLCRVESFAEERTDPKRLGFDAAVDFQPDWSVLDARCRPSPIWHAARLPAVAKMLANRSRVFDYGRTVDAMLGREPPRYERFPCVFPSWDNTARRTQAAIAFTGSTPEHYERWLKHVLEQSARAESRHNVVFINAWNEWAEGNHLEPDRRHGHAYLEATRRALESVPEPRRTRQELPTPRGTEERLCRAFP